LSRCAPDVLVGYVDAQMCWWSVLRHHNTDLAWSQWSIAVSMFQHPDSCVQWFYDSSMSLLSRFFLYFPFFILFTFSTFYIILFSFIHFKILDSVLLLNWFFSISLFSFYLFSLHFISFFYLYLYLHNFTSLLANDLNSDVPKILVIMSLFSLMTVLFLFCFFFWFCSFFNYPPLSAKIRGSDHLFGYF